MRERLRRARRARGWTQAQLAARVGICQQTLSKHEHGIITPGHFDLIRQYEAELGVPARELFPDIFNA